MITDFGAKTYDAGLSVSLGLSFLQENTKKVISIMVISFRFFIGKSFLHIIIVGYVV